MNSAEAAALRNTLRQRNTALARDYQQLELSLSDATVLPLLEPYRQKMIGICKGVGQEVETNLDLLRLNLDILLEDVLSKTRGAAYNLRLLSGRLVSPILRGGPHDVLCLTILNWMHRAHSETALLPAVFTDGDVAVWPIMRIAPVYSFPALEQKGLLYQSLHFHEFGHGLYVLHRPEMDALVKELQLAIERTLTPLSQRNDRYAVAQRRQKETVVKRWFDWVQEFFCDAVGLTLGGAAYLYAFSAYCGNLVSTDFYLPAQELERSKHPLTWLRIQMLVRRAKELGLTQAALEVETEWSTIGRVMKVVEDHHGFYEVGIGDDLHRILGDMLMEANPRSFLPEEVLAAREATNQDTPVLLLNRAWQIQMTRPDDYPEWEEKAIRAYVGSTV